MDEHEKLLTWCSAKENIALTLRAVLQWFYGREEARNFLYILHLHLLTDDNSVVAFCTVS